MGCFGDVGDGPSSPCLFERWACPLPIFAAGKKRVVELFKNPGSGLGRWLLRTAGFWLVAGEVVCDLLDATETNQVVGGEVKAAWAAGCGWVGGWWWWWSGGGGGGAAGNGRFGGPAFQTSWVVWVPQAMKPSCWITLYQCRRARPPAGAMRVAHVVGAVHRQDETHPRRPASGAAGGSRSVRSSR